MGFETPLEKAFSWSLVILGIFALSFCIVACIKGDQIRSERYNECVRDGNEVIPVVNGYMCRDKNNDVVDEWRA